VVEDDPAILKLISATLRRAGMQVDAVASGADALQRLGTSRYQVVLTDLMMPGVSGWEVIQWLREHAERRPQSLIVVTAAGRGVLTALDKEVVNAVVLKPFDLGLLAAYVRACCDLHGRDRRRRRLIV
jgi:CheY-like chemotaxis protein